ncbi:unnamed protein product [Hymenolepis diminuta]|uniref:UBC core domain-containing protein n=2 Tax=Hymenolepis diminuta TaxID=6216 RepID=A0A0R3SAG9_HYMDI|nr:unnamed protein product [Hymenolepis diminuta]
MTPQDEFDKIIEFANTLTGQLFIDKYTRSPFELTLDILPIPGGTCKIFFSSSYPEIKPGWIVTFGRQVVDAVFPVEVSTILQAFMCCMFVITKRLEEELPSAVVEFDPSFFYLLNLRLPGHSVGTFFV